mmetsp:Transcript_15555/g.45006  ORF Transcript_15555/g.45006 Transcript_15555/m.45006 type:complete len:228 (+) Transcript_15555:746-1429(+)
MSLLECCCSSSILVRPSASAMKVAIWLCEPVCLASSSPILRMFSRPSRAMVTILASLTVRRSHRGRMQPCWTRNLIWAALPPEVALLMAQAASLRISNSALARSWIRGGMMLLSMTAWIWSLLPAVMLEMVQQASLRIPFLGDERRARRQGRALLLMMNWVWRSSPVTMLPTVRRAGVCTAGEGLRRSSTRRRQTPASMTAWIFSLGPSERYDRAQHASVRTSSSGL